MNKIESTIMSKIESPLMNKIYELCVQEPDLPVKEVLKKLNITQAIYNNLIKHHPSICKYRMAYLGYCRKMTEEHKEKVVKNLENCPFRKNKTTKE
jgi:hypothetical protein